MAKLTPIRTFLLRQEDAGEKRKKDVIAHKGLRIEVTDSEHKRFHNYFKEPYLKKKGPLSMK